MAQGIVIAVALGCGVVYVRSRTRATPSPHDVRLFEDRYRARGLRVLAVRRIGTDWPQLRFGRRPPIRKYEIDIEGPDGLRETRVRGVSRGQFDGDTFWRYDRHGLRERMH